ncbi:uncharacterized protein LOC130613596 [Hydractinia symbiolongicarpus]|uniref:uncharacterized protein LOC130613596 n=1 Tax=Hydractinia symbiolongicarpus TaxID=13093 RepID=UPI00254C677F|nr:uncharacterized protein LOC130613596 [Hydractinia symbiolongicarpus]
MAAVLLLLFTMLKLSAGLKYEVIRTRSGSDKIIFKTNKTGICTKYGATYFAKTEETTTCICSPGTTFYSVHSELPACHSSSANNLGCGCVGKCMSLITAELSMNRIFPKPVVWCNQTKPRSFKVSKKSIAPPYEIIRQQSEPDKVVFKTSQSDICKTYGATYFAKTVETITCVCSPGTTFYSVHTELPACHSSSADNLGGCGCIGQCMGLITPELSMNRIFPSPVVWYNRTQPKYIIKKWAMDGWKDFSRPNDMSLTYSVEEGKGVLRFRVSSPVFVSLTISQFTLIREIKNKFTFFFSFLFYECFY